MTYFHGDKCQTRLLAKTATQLTNIELWPNINVSVHFGHLLPMLTYIPRIRSLRPTLFFQCIIHCIPIIYVWSFSITMWLSLSLLYPKLESCDLLSSNRWDSDPMDAVQGVSQKNVPVWFLVDFSFKGAAYLGDKLLLNWIPLLSSVGPYVIQLRLLFHERGHHQRSCNFMNLALKTMGSFPILNIEGASYVSLFQ